MTQNISKVKNSSWAVIAIYLGVAVYLLPMFPHGGSANELTRWATAASLIEKGSFEISWTQKLIGPNVDTAKIGDRTYSNKAPGPAILAAPFYAVTRIFIGSPDASNIRISWYVMRLATATLPLLLLALWLYRTGADEFSLAALLFATPMLLYSTLFFSHVLTAVLLYAAFRILFDRDNAPLKHLLIAGALSGLAVISEFPAVFAVAIFAVGLMLKGKADAAKRVGIFVLGGLPFAVFLLAYNNALFGSPFSFSYAHESFGEWAAVADQGVFGLGFPTPSNIYLLLASPSRGLIFTSPILLLSARLMWKEEDRRSPRYIVRLAAIVIVTLIICGHGAAHGGWAFGPRYLVMLMPLMLDPIFVRKREPNSIAAGALLALSICLNVLPLLTFPFAPPQFAFPHNSFFFTYLRDEGWFVPTLANLLGVAPTIWTIIPILAAAVAVAVLAAKRFRPAAFAAAAAVSVLVFALYIAVPGLDQNDDTQLREATIAERFYRPEGRLESPEFRSTPDRYRAAKMSAMMIADARAYAPDDFPYLTRGELPTSPSSELAAANDLVAKKKFDQAAALIEGTRVEHPELRCELTTSLAIVRYSQGDKDAALAELAANEPLIDGSSTPECARSLYLAGMLYSERGESEASLDRMRRFLSVTDGINDTETKKLRAQAERSLRPK